MAAESGDGFDEWTLHSAPAYHASSSRPAPRRRKLSFSMVVPVPALGSA
jgi:hypothetical protein